MAKISHRLNIIESYFNNFSHSTSDKLNIKKEIEKGALVYPSIPFRYSDEADFILTKLKKNLFLAYSEIEIQDQYKKELEDQIALTKIISDFIQPYKIETIKKLQSHIDWAKNFKGSYLFYDNMLSGNFVSSTNGFFNNRLSVFKFCGKLEYNTFMSSYSISSSATDLNGVVLSSGDDFISYRGQSRSSKLEVKFSIKTNSTNYGCAIRSDSAMVIYSEKTTEYDSMSNSGNTTFNMMVYGVFNGKTYEYDFNISLSIFSQSSSEFIYETVEIPSSKLKNKMKIKKDFNDKIVDVEIKTLLRNNNEILSITKPVDLTKTGNILYELNEDNEEKIEFVSDPIIKDIRKIGPTNSINYSGIQTNLTFNKPERVFLGLNSFNKTGKKESVIDTIENNGTSTFLVKEIYSTTGVGEGYKSYDVPLTIVNNNTPFVSSQVKNENDEYVDCKQFSLFGKIMGDNVYIKEHQITYTKASGVSTALTKNKYMSIYDSTTNMTTIIISSNATPDSITYSVSLASLLIKPANQSEYEGQYVIRNFDVYTDLYINDSNFFSTTHPENSILTVTTDTSNNVLLVKSSKYSDVDLDKFFAETLINVVTVTFDISLTKEKFLDEYETEIYMLQDDVFNVRLNDSDDNKRGYFYKLNNTRTDFISGTKGRNIVLRLYGSDEYAVKHTKAYDSETYVVHCLGILENGNGEVSKSKFGVTSLRTVIDGETVSEHYFQFYNNPFDYVSYGSSVICDPDVKSIPFAFGYKKIYDKTDISFKVVLKSTYQGYPLNKISIWSI